MSRHTIPARDSKHSVTVGWDPPLQTYFAHVKDWTRDEEDEMVLRVGGWFGEVQSVSALAVAILGYADLLPAMAQTLASDRQME
jgi:hypothetical protein